MFLRMFAAFCLFAAYPNIATAQDKDWLDDIRMEHGVPALAVLVNQNDQTVLLQVSGERKFGSGIAADTGDLWHIGSNTKSITATLIGRLVEKGQLSFESKVIDVFPEFTSEIHPDYHSVTLLQLLSHQAGLKPNPGMVKFMGYFLSEETLPLQRIDLLKSMMEDKPNYAPGTKYLYSNAGYVIAGAMAERVMAKPWEELVAEEVLGPLGIADFGFGAPGSPDKIDQPWGHKDRTFWFGRTAMKPGVQADNPAVLGPAGTLHLSLEGWARYAVDHIQGEKGQGQLLSQETYEFLHEGHRVISEASSYALGWGVSKIDNTDLRMLGHTGSNTMWYARIELIPERDLVFLIVTNDGTSIGKDALRAVREKLHQTYIYGDTENDEIEVTGQ